MNIEQFGSGHSDIDSDNVVTMTDQELALHLGEIYGCPQAPSIIEAEGAKKMAHRYGELISFYEETLGTIQAYRPDIAATIANGQPRKADEPLTYDDGFIPEWNKSHIPGTETIWGYDFTRLVNSYIRDDHGLTIDQTDKFPRASEMLENTLKKLSPNEGADELLLKFAESLVDRGGANVDIILRRTIDAAKLKQDSMYTDFTRVVGKMEKCSPTLWNRYIELDSTQRAQMKIADIVL